VTFGDIGYPVVPGKSKKIVCNYSQIVLDPANLKFLLIADDLHDTDIGDLLKQVDTPALITLMKEIAGPRNFKDSKSQAHLEAVRKYLQRSFKEDGLEVSRQPFNMRITRPRTS